ncbi:uncharacterized protein [Oryctolagus cuniculus]|uniref:uncharacterized protein n=1 Tax=Oryctolagus cuniculus TaxID=9986 RepID=UPI003879247F
MQTARPAGGGEGAQGPRPEQFSWTLGVREGCLSSPWGALRRVRPCVLTLGGTAQGVSVCLSSPWGCTNQCPSVGSLSGAAHWIPGVGHPSGAGSGHWIPSVGHPSGAGSGHWIPGVGHPSGAGSGHWIPGVGHLSWQDRDTGSPVWDICQEQDRDTGSPAWDIRQEQDRDTGSPVWDICRGRIGTLDPRCGTSVRSRIGTLDPRCGTSVRGRIGTLDPRCGTSVRGRIGTLDPRCGTSVRSRILSPRVLAFLAPRFVSAGGLCLEEAAEGARGERPWTSLSSLRVHGGSWSLSFLSVLGCAWGHVQNVCSYTVVKPPVLGLGPGEGP